MTEEEKTEADNQQHNSDEGDAAKDGDVVQGDKIVKEDSSNDE